MPIEKLDNSELGAQGRNKVNKNVQPSGAKGSNPARAAGRIRSARINPNKK